MITMLLFILGAVCFHTAKFLNGPKLSRASKLSSHWSKFHGAGMTINDSFGKRGKQTLSLTHTHTHAVLPDWAVGGFEFDCAGKYWLGRVDKIWAGFWSVWRFSKHINCIG